MKLNKKFKAKILASIVISLLITLVGFLLTAASSDKGVPISRYDLQAEITSDGVLKMHETYNYGKCNYHTQIRTINTSGTEYAPSTRLGNFTITVSDGVNSFTRVQGDGRRNESNMFFIAFEGERDEIGDKVDYNSYVINVDENYGKLSPKIQVEVEYEVYGAVEVYNDFANLNYVLVGDDALDISNVTVSLKYPKVIPFSTFGEEDNLRQEKIYYFGYGSDANFDLSSQDEGILKINAKKVDHNSNIELHTYFPSSAVENAEKINASGWSLILKTIEEGQSSSEIAHSEYVIMRTLNLLVSFVVTILTLGLIAVFIYMFREVYYQYDKEHATTFNEKYYRDLVKDYPPAMLGYLYHEKDIGKNDLSATLMNLIYKGYIEIDTNGANQLDKNPNYKYIYHREKDTSSLAKHEKYLLTWYFDELSKGKDEITLDEIDNLLKKESNALAYTKCNNNWNKLAVSDASKYNFFEGEVEKGAKKYNFFLIFIFLAAFAYFASLAFVGANIFLAILFFLTLSIGLSFIFYINQVKRKTQEGQEDYVRWVAFENFLKDFSRLQDYSVTSLAIWDQYLVYATALGIADLVEKQLRTKYKEMYAENTNNDYPLWYFGYYSYHRYRFMRTYTISSTTIANAKAARSSSGRGGGGHFGGGSSRGGGGSHSRFR